jgi:hypothetical protein
LKRLAVTLRIAAVEATELLVTDRLRLVFLLGPALVLAGLALPSPDSAASAKITSSFALWTVCILTWFFAILVPGFLGSRERKSAMEALARTRPVPMWSLLTGKLLASAGLLTAWWVVLGLSAWAAISIDCLDGGISDLEPPHRIMPASPSQARELTSQGPMATYEFSGLESLPPGPLRAEFQAAFKLVDPGSTIFGTPVRIEAENPGSGARRTLFLDRPSFRKPFRFSLPRDTAFPGGRVVMKVGLGPSPFLAKLEPDSLCLLGERSPAVVNFAASAILVLALGLFLTVLSLAASQLLSAPVAIGAAAGFLAIGSISDFAGRAAAAWSETMPGGRFPARTGDPNPVLEAYLSGVRWLCSALPDFSAFNRAGDFAGAVEIGWCRVLELCTAVFLYAVPLAVAALVLMRRSEE